MRPAARPRASAEERLLVVAGDRLTDAPATALATLTLLLAVRATRVRSVGSYAAASAAAGLAAAAKYNTAVVAIVLPVAWLLAERQSPHRRLKAIEALARAGVPVGVSVSPIIPFINEPEIERIVEAAAAAGASSAFGIVVRLPWEVNPIFQRWLDQHFPDRAARVMARIREMRGGRDYDASFDTRMRGEGIWAELIAQRLAKARTRFGLDHERQPLDLTQFRKPLAASDAGQGDLFG